MVDAAVTEPALSSESQHEALIIPMFNSQQGWPRVPDACQLNHLRQNSTQDMHSVNACPVADSAATAATVYRASLGCLNRLHSCDNAV